MSEKMSEKERREKALQAVLDNAELIKSGGSSYETGIPCDPPDIKGDECLPGYSPECVNNYIVCKRPE